MLYVSVSDRSNATTHELTENTPQVKQAWAERGSLYLSLRPNQAPLGHQVAGALIHDGATPGAEVIPVGGTLSVTALLSVEALPSMASVVLFALSAEKFGDTLTVSAERGRLVVRYNGSTRSSTPIGTGLWLDVRLSNNRVTVALTTAQESHSLGFASNVFEPVWWALGLAVADGAPLGRTASLALADMRIESDATAAPTPPTVPPGLVFDGGSIPGAFLFVGDALSSAFVADGDVIRAP